MTQEELLSALRELLTRHKQLKLDLAAITLETRLDQIGFDSLSILEFIYDVEERFKVETSVADLVALKNVQELVSYLQTKLTP